MSSARQHKFFSRRIRARALPTTTPFQIDPPPANKGGEAPKGACQPLPRSTDKRCRWPMPGRGGPLYRSAPAFRRFTAALAGTVTSRLSFRPCFLERGHNGRYPLFRRPSAVEAPHASAVVPRRMMPKAAPARVASPRGSTALAPHFGSHPECAPR